jgi:hypothetical protein
MAKMISTLRTHWKKSIFFSGVAGFGLNYAHNKFNEKIMMKNFCKEALAYGEPTVPVSHVRKLYLKIYTKYISQITLKNYYVFEAWSFFGCF